MKHLRNRQSVPLSAGDPTKKSLPIARQLDLAPKRKAFGNSCLTGNIILFIHGDEFIVRSVSLLVGL